MCSVDLVDKVFEFHTKSLSISRELGDRAAQERAKSSLEAARANMR